LNGVLVAAGSRGSAILDSASRHRQEAEPERRDVSAP
jgi:hypothetical protein